MPAPGGHRPWGQLPAPWPCPGWGQPLLTAQSQAELLKPMARAVTESQLAWHRASRGDRTPEISQTGTAKLSLAKGTQQPLPEAHSSCRTGNGFFMFHSAGSCFPHQFLHLFHGLPSCHLRSSPWEAQLHGTGFLCSSCTPWPQSQFAPTAGTAQAEPSCSAAQH